MKRVSLAQQAKTTVVCVPTAESGAIFGFSALVFDKLSLFTPPSFFMMVRRGDDVKHETRAFVEHYFLAYVYVSRETVARSCFMV